MDAWVYFCIEFMDAGSLGELWGPSVRVPRGVLAWIATGIVQGLCSLKDELQVIHQDMKITNILVNTQGHIKLCDFGISGQLVESQAKTNFGS